MKKIFTIMVLLSAIIFAQEVQEKKKDSVAVYKSGWFIGGGISYPRYMAISTPNVSANDNSGAYLTLCYNVT
ncbi:MAG: hypothetical protein H6613_00560 [Ignavibacteriales bacterium]|nr:hypothetical protein [Ignavibacteriales bacterium]